MSGAGAGGDGAESIYREVILEEYKHPRNKGRLQGATHAFCSTNATCGDEIEMQLKVEDGRVADVRFDGTGCAISQAAASLFTEHIKGKPLAEVLAMDERAIVELFGFAPNPMRMKCAVLPLRATAEALEKGARPAGEGKAKAKEAKARSR